MNKILLTGLICCLFFSCQRDHNIEHVERAFYYWKSDDWSFDDGEEKCIDTLKVTKLYVKFFEVKYDKTLGNIPIAKTRLNENAWFDRAKKINLNIVPTVFIKNEVFLKSKKAEIDTLVSNVNFLVSKYHKDRFLNYPKYAEIQIDCDWTLKTRDNYFYFLEKLSKVASKDISCTLRLYPYKYRTKMGIPPVKRATLMCYNLMQPFAYKNKNSILDSKELDSYLTVDKKYPLHLDVALPLFSWAYHYQYDEFKGFVKLNETFLEKACTKKSAFWYEVKKDTSLAGNYFRVGDKIKYEDVSQDKINDAIQQLKSRVKFDKSTTVTFFHLDSTIIKKYNYETLSRFYTSFSN